MQQADACEERRYDSASTNASDKKCFARIIWNQLPALQAAGEQKLHITIFKLTGSCNVSSALQVHVVVNRNTSSFVAKLKCWQSADGQFSPYPLQQTLRGRIAGDMELVRTFRVLSGQFRIALRHARIWYNVFSWKNKIKKRRSTVAVPR